MTNEELNTALYQKMFAEQEVYRNWLLSLPAEEILHHCYEYTCREDILLCLENNDLSGRQARALLKSPTPVADVFKKWESWETGYMSNILSCVECRANDVLREEYLATAIWDIKGRVDKVISYATNPQKTDASAMQYAADLHAIERVVEYTADEMKTEKCCFVSGINCDPDQAAHQFLKSKKHWKKEGGIVAFHGYQSFRAGEVDADTAHQIGVALAKELWGDRFEVVVATHLNTDHYHNHFVINSVWQIYNGGSKKYALPLKF